MIPMSWITAVSQAFEDAAIQNVTICIASGDTGAQSKVFDAKAHVQYPGSDPWVLAVGGTTVGNVVGTSCDEWAWDDATGASGGGVSDFFPPPWYQVDANVPGSVNDGHRGRGVPDVSANASPSSGYPFILGSSLELLPGPEFDGGQPQGDSFHRHRQARMHQNSAHRVRPQSPSLVSSTVDSIRQADCVGLLSLKCKFSRIVQHQERAAVRRDPISGRLKMAGQDLLFADAVIGEKAIGGLRVRPILTHQWDASTQGTSDPPKEFAKSLRKALIAKLAPGYLSINPRLGFDCRTAVAARSAGPCRKIHGAPPVANQVLSHD
jgi:hypothetical protein